MEQLGFEGMPRRLYPCTPTRLSAWLDCPRRYRMSYLDRPPPPKGPPWAHNSLGASIHNALAGWWRLPLAQRTVAAAGTLVDRGWIDEGFAGRDPVACGSASVPSPWWRATSPGSTRPTSRSAWNGRSRPARTRSRSPAGSTASTPGPPNPLREPSSWSWTTRPGGTCSPRTTRAARMALALYALAAGRALRRPCHRVELHHLPTGEILGLVAHR